MQLDPVNIEVLFIVTIPDSFCKIKAEIKSHFDTKISLEFLQNNFTINIIKETKKSAPLFFFYSLFFCFDAELTELPAELPFACFVIFVVLLRHAGHHYIIT